MSKHLIYADYDHDGIFIYQAYNHAIADSTLLIGRLGGGGFKRERMTWIKPSFGWMLYRAGYARKPDQERILKIKLHHRGFLQALAWAVESSWNRRLYTNESDWKAALAAAPARAQWDPDRDLYGTKLERRAIQIGLRGIALDAYINEWIIHIEDVTMLARSIGAHVQARQPLVELRVPDERLYLVNDVLLQRIGGN
jgi:hypothetical protein